MQRKKFRSAEKARRFASTTKHIAHKGKATKLADGTKANWYTFTKWKGAPKKRKR